MASASSTSKRSGLLFGTLNWPSSIQTPQRASGTRNPRRPRPDTGGRKSRFWRRARARPSPQLRSLRRPRGTRLPSCQRMSAAQRNLRLQPRTSARGSRARHEIPFLSSRRARVGPMRMRRIGAGRRRTPNRLFISNTYSDKHAVAYNRLTYVLFLLTVTSVLFLVTKTLFYPHSSIQ